ncbi:signal peptidase I [Vagococcus fluvialis]|nr:signal peptidase I [Vagococcus fluvialis]
MVKKRKIPNKSYQKRKNNKLNKSKVSVWDILLATVISVFIFTSLFTLFFPIRVVKGISMSPIIRSKEKIIVSRFYRNINRFDVVSIKAGNQCESKRVIGLPGERVRYSDNILYINEEVVEETYLRDQLNEYHQRGEVLTQSVGEENSFESGVIPKGYYFVLSDNRSDASDSRQFGFVSGSDIKGKIFYSLLSFNPIR